MEKQLIFERISKVMSEVGAISKDNTNKMQGYKYRGIDDMYNALNSVLANNKVFATSEVIKQTREERESKGGGILIYTILDIKFKFYTDDGSFVESTMVGEAMDSGDKSSNKAMSTAFKYALMQLFCIPTEEEKDTEAQSPEVGKKTYTNLNYKVLLTEYIGSDKWEFREWYSTKHEKNMSAWVSVNNSKDVIWDNAKFYKKKEEYELNEHLT